MSATRKDAEDAVEYRKKSSRPEAKSCGKSAKMTDNREERKKKTALRAVFS
jgi:hypothetical protein